MPTVPTKVITLSSVTVAPQKVVVQTDTVRGPTGKSPDVSIYNAVALLPINGVLTIDASKATSVYVILNQNVTDIVITNLPPASKTQRIAVYLQQDSAGNRVISKWPNNTKWSNGQPPDISKRAGAIDCILFDTFDNGNTVFGSFVGQDYR